MTLSPSVPSLGVLHFMAAEIATCAATDFPWAAWADPTGVVTEPLCGANSRQRSAASFAVCDSAIRMLRAALNSLSMRDPTALLISYQNSSSS